MGNLCACGCGGYTKTDIAKYIQGHHNRDSKVKEKKRKTCLKNFGVESPGQSADVRKKYKETCLKRYGVSNVSKCDNIKKKKLQTAIENFGGIGFSSDIIKSKIDLNILENYGVDNISKSHKIKKKKIKIAQKTFGVNNVFQSNKIKRKIKQTNMNRFGVENPMQSESIKQKSKETCLKRYGVEYALQCRTVQDKRKSTCLEKYGFECVTKSKKIKEKIKKTCLEKYGTNNWSKSDNGRISHRKNAIRRIEDQLLNGEPLMPNIGKKERPFLNELQKYCKYPILRQDPSFRYIIGRFPDGYVKELKLFILFDEFAHFDDKECTILNEESLQESKDYKSIQDHNLFRVSEKDWLENPQLIINRFEDIINEHY